MVPMLFQRTKLDGKNFFVKKDGDFSLAHRGMLSHQRYLKFERNDVIVVFQGLSSAFLISCID